MLHPKFRAKTSLAEYLGRSMNSSSLGQNRISANCLPNKILGCAGTTTDGERQCSGLAAAAQLGIRRLGVMPAGLRTG